MLERTLKKSNALTLKFKFPFTLKQTTEDLATLLPHSHKSVIRQTWALAVPQGEPGLQLATVPTPFLSLDISSFRSYVSEPAS